MNRLCLLIVLCLAADCPAVDLHVANVPAFNDAVSKVTPGDRIVLKAGEWKDADLLLRATGTLDKPITLCADPRGSVKLSGSSRLRIAGEHLVVQGLWFHNCVPKSGDIIRFRENAKRLASHCALEDCAITSDVPANDGEDRKWLSLYGAENRVTRCHFEGKTSAGTLLVVWLPQVSVVEPPKHQIAHNYFGPRPRLGKNGGEIIRVGDSGTSMQVAACLVVNNVFERCDGEMECISNKSGDNIYRGNTFIECQGTLTLRHGNRCVVESNVFFGNGRKQTGGIRVIGEDHRVVGNHLEGLAGTDARAAICLMNGITDSPLNGYFQVKRALIEGNTIVDCRQSVNIGFADADVKATMPPIDTALRRNIIWADKQTVVQLADLKAQVEWAANKAWGRELEITASDGIDFNPFERPKMPTVVARQARGTTWKVPVAREQERVAPK